MASLRAYSVAFLGVLLLFGAGVSQPAQAEESLRDSTSLRLIPADAAFYRTCLRNREQLQTVMESNALRRLAEAPRMARWLAAWKARWDDPDRSVLRRWYERPENRDLVEFAADALSHEIFWYGDASFAELLHLTARVNEAATATQLESLRSGRSLADSERAAAHVALQLLAEDPEQLRVPALVIGFKITDADRARRQIARLEETLRSQFASRWQLVEQLRRESLAGGEFLTWRLDGSMLPWDLVPPSESERVDPQLRRRVKEVLRSKKATVSVGVRGDYFLISMGESNDHLAKLGQAPLLLDRPELAPLANVADRPLTTVVYISEEYRQKAAAANRHQIHGSFLFETFLQHPEALGQDAKRSLDQQTRSELAADLKTLASELTAAASQKGATLRFAFLTPRGYEGYVYGYSKEHRLDATQPLTVLNHLGGDPLGFLAVRGQFTLEDYERWVKWLGRGRYYFEKIALKEMSQRQRAAYTNLRRQTDPLLARLDQANRELLIPALQDGQKAIVLDASPHGAAQFVSEGEAAQEPPQEGLLPWPEIALVCGVSDAEKFKQGCQEYFAVIGQAWTGVRNFIEQVRVDVKTRSNAPQVRLPELPTADELRPLAQPTPQGELYFYQLPERLSQNGRVAPNLALSNDFLALSYLPDYSLRLLEEQPLQGEGPLADLDRPLAAAAYLDFAGLIDALAPWLERGVERRQERRAERRQERNQEESPQAAPNQRAAAPRAPAARAQAPRAAAARTQAPRAAAARTQAPRAPAARSSALPTPPPQAAPAPRAVTPRARAAQLPTPPESAASARVVRGQDAPSAEPLSPREAKEQLRLALDLLRCFRGFACVTYQEDDARVTHYELRFEDLPK